MPMHPAIFKRPSGAVPSCLFMLACAQGACAQESPPDELVRQLPKVEVRGDRDLVPKAEFDGRSSVTTRSADVLQRTQPASIFEALKDVPNVSVNGGPRASGMGFNIRGYSDNEDVLIKLDGVAKGFEKYRFGGTFVEPDLLKMIEVQRGPQISSGSGALGGTISATTKEAGDLLRPGERWGAQIKQSHASNNNEDLTSVILYGRPTADTSLLVNGLRRASDDLQLSDGSRLALSSADTRSSLLKASTVLGEFGLLSFSLVKLRDSGLQPYDATGGQAGFFGSVQRDIDDQTRSLTFEYAPANTLINLKAVFGQATTRLVDVHQPGKTPFANVVTGVVTDTYDYTNRTLDIANTSTVAGLPFGLELKTGLQWLESARDTSRVRQKIPGSGFDASIPPGTKRNLAAYLQPRLTVGQWEFIPGIRTDRYEVIATGGTAALLAANKEPDRIAFDKVTGSFGAVYHWLPDRLSMFYNYADSFRPPLTDEYFTQGAFGRCATFLLGTLAPKSQVCGSLYTPQKAANQEVGVTWSEPLPDWKGRMDTKLTVFQIDTSNLLRSIQAVSATAIGQPGWEERHGFELETSLRTARGYLRGSYARIRGTVDVGGGKVPSRPEALYNVPGDTVNASAGLFFGKDVEVGIGVQQVSARGVILNTVSNVNIIGTQQGYRLWSANARWTINRNLELRLSGENLSNQKYQLSNGFGGGIGFEAPGRNLRVALVVKI